MEEQTPHKSKWWAKMKAIHGSEAAVREFMAANANKSKRNLGGKGGFAKLTPKQRKEMSQHALDKRYKRTQ